MNTLSKVLILGTDNKNTIKKAFTELRRALVQIKNQVDSRLRSIRKQEYCLFIGQIIYCTSNSKDITENKKFDIVDMQKFKNCLNCLKIRKNAGGTYKGISGSTFKDAFLSVLIKNSWMS